MRGGGIEKLLDIFLSLHYMQGPLKIRIAQEGDAIKGLKKGGMAEILNDYNL